jgi:hypothetical protein
MTWTKRFDDEPILEKFRQFRRQEDHIAGWEYMPDRVVELFIQSELEEIIKLSDKIELEGESTTFEEWKAFKHFRNTLRDKYLKP